MLYDCIIIGAGAAGLYCSAAFDRPVKGLILEKTRRPGTKLLMSGGGQCNVTHGGSIKDFVNCYGKNGGKIRSCLYKYNNQQLMEFLRSGGIETITREDGKVFPKSMNARDILNLLLAKSRENGFSIQYERPVTGIARTAEGLWQVAAAEENYLCRNLVIATGGCSYPTTGSDGSIFPILRRDLAIDIIPLRPALTPVKVTGYPYRDLAGLSFADVHLSVWRNEKKAAEAVGDLLFTHENFSGPLVLNLSNKIHEGDKIQLNYLYPDHRNIVLEKISTALENNKAGLVNLLSRQLGLPKSFIQILVGDTGDKRKEIATRLTMDTFTVDNISGFHKAMVTAGGISLMELNPRTMEFKNFPGLYAIGEVLDVDGCTGGYNLQFAYSSAKAASSDITSGIK